MFENATRRIQTAIGKQTSAIANELSKYSGGWIRSTQINGAIDKILGIRGNDKISPKYKIEQKPVIINTVNSEEISSMTITIVEESVKSTRLGAKSFSDTVTTEDLKPKFKLLNKAFIRLPMPQQLNPQYKNSWDGSSTASLGTEIYKLFENKEVTLKDAAGKLSDVAQNPNQLTGRAKRLGTKAFVENILGESAGNYYDFKNRQLTNESKQLMYRGPEFRTFTFEYDLVPNNETDVFNYMAIIRALKYFSAPEYSADKVIIKYPALFNIKFDSPKLLEAGNNFQLKLTKCALTDMEVNYTPDGLWKTFSNGLPIHIKLNLTFQETSLLFRENIIGLASNEDGGEFY